MAGFSFKTQCETTGFVMIVVLCEVCISHSFMHIIAVTPAENAQALSIMLEVSQWLGQLTLELFWPREAHCYMKGDLILSQKLGLATR
jgi:hypothetical protein